jgi:hypothetical protein
MKPNEIGDISATLSFAKIGVKHCASVIKQSSKKFFIYTLGATGFAFAFDSLIFSFDFFLFFLCFAFTTFNFLFINFNNYVLNGNRLLLNSPVQQLKRI